LTHELDNEDYEEKAALYALGALSQHEARSFERHLAEGCSSCEASMLQFEQVVGTLAFEPPAATPSVYIRDMLLARIEREGQSEAASTARPQSLEPGRLPKSPHAATTLSQRSPRSQSSLGRMIPWAVAASLAIAVLGSLFALNRAGRKSADLRAQLAAAENERRRVGDRASELAQINEVLLSAEHREIALAGQPPAPSASAKIYWNVQNNKWVVTANLPPPPKGKVYQLWFVTAQEKVSAGLIMPDESGHGFTVTDVPANIGSIAAAAITLEPDGGSDQPTMPIYVVGAAG
jgi:anti-sigma-K factor RskA